MITYINFVKQDPPITWKTFTPYMKPIVLEFFQGVYFMVFGLANKGEVQFVTYTEREGFVKPRKPYNLSPKNFNRNVMNESRGQMMN